MRWQKKCLKIIFLLPVSISLAGCLYYGQYGPRVSSDVASHPIDPGYFNYTREPISPQVLSTSDRGTYAVQKLLFPTRIAYLYIPNGITRAPAVVVLPVSNGNDHAKRLANFLAANGFICLRFQSRGTLFQVSRSQDPLSEFERFLKAYVIDVLKGMDWLADYPTVDRDRIGIVGISLGALIGTIVTGVDSRIKSGVFLLSGGDVSGILFSSKEPSILSVRKRMEDQEDLSPEEIRRELQVRLRPLDPLTYADRVGPKTVLMINAYFDRVIKRRYTMALWKALGKPPMIQLPTGHFSATLFFNYAEQKALAHFQKVLGQPD
ncbi:MAG TPA: hypothetical protein VJK28_01800 [Nitrospiria bacterium]|nr:hypothetical protein [Nitrospiria bacterium]